MSNTFIVRVNNPPIYTSTNSSNLKSTHPILNLPNIAEQTLPLQPSENQQTQSNWQKWLQQIVDVLNYAEYYGNPSLLLNSDFYWNRAIASPVTQADGNGAFFSEKWQVEGAGVATYTLTQTAYAGNANNQTGSTTYIHVQVSSYTSGDFYFYQRQAGAQFLRRYQGRTLNFSYSIINNQTKAIKFGLEVYFYFDTDNATYSQHTIFLNPGLNENTSTITTNMIGTTSVGASPYVEFRLRMVDLIDGTADFNLQYLKVEMADIATPLYVDHALEKTRIDNS